MCLFMSTIQPTSEVRMLKYQTLLKKKNPKTLKQGNNKGKKLKVDSCPDIVVLT